MSRKEIERELDKIDRALTSYELFLRKLYRDESLPEWLRLDAKEKLEELRTQQ